MTAYDVSMDGDRESVATMPQIRIVCPPNGSAKDIDASLDGVPLRHVIYAGLTMDPNGTGVDRWPVLTLKILVTNGLEYTGPVPVLAEAVTLAELRRQRDEARWGRWAPFRRWLQDAQLRWWRLQRWARRVTARRTVAA